MTDFKLSTLTAALKRYPGRFLLAVLVIAGLAYFNWDGDAPSAPSQSGKFGRKGQKKSGFDNEGQIPTVAYASSRRQDIPVYLNGLGTITALHTVTVRARVDGELIKVNFREGQFVKQGEILAEIDPRPFQIQLQQAEGQLIRDEALLKNAQIDLSRYQTLLEQDSIAPQQTATQAALVKQYQGNLEIDRAQVENARLQLQYARISAPVSGRIGLRLVDQGNMIRNSDSNGLAIITQLQPITAVFTLPEDTVPALMQHWREQQTLAVEAYDRAGKQRLAQGQLLAIDNQIDTTTGTLKLKAQFDNQDLTLFSNQFVNIRLHLDTLRNTIAVPTAAIQQGTQGAFVYVIRSDQTVTVKTVHTGSTTDDGWIAINNGLEDNQKVVIDGADRLREGMTVNLPKEVQSAQASNSTESVASTPTP